jgi:hypothetical protein
MHRVISRSSVLASPDTQCSNAAAVGSKPKVWPQIKRTFSLPQLTLSYAPGLMFPPTLVVCVAAPLNMLLNFLLVWGPDPIRIGFLGAPLSTAISWNLMVGARHFLRMSSIADQFVLGKVCSRFPLLHFSSA